MEPGVRVEQDFFEWHSERTREGLIIHSLLHARTRARARAHTLLCQACAHVFDLSDTCRAIEHLHCENFRCDESTGYNSNDESCKMSRSPPLQLGQLSAFDSAFHTCIQHICFGKAAPPSLPPSPHPTPISPALISLSASASCQNQPASTLSRPATSLWHNSTTSRPPHTSA